MASLQGTQINNTYPGLFKTDNNLGLNPMPGMVSNVSDGNGTVINLQLGINDIRFPGGNVDFTGSTVTGLPGGGGGSAGLVSGTGTDSMKSADTLTTNAASAPTTNSIAIGNGATIASNPTRPSWETLGHIALGKGVSIIENSFADVYSKSTIAIGEDAQVNPYYDGGNIAIGDSANSTNMHGIAIGAATTAYRFGVAIGQSANAGGDSSFSLGRFSQASALNTVAIGASASATNTNSIAIGQGATATGATAISIGDGNTNQNGPNLSVGRGNNNIGNGGTIIGQSNTIGLGNGGCAIIGSNLNIPAGINDAVLVGRVQNPSGNINNSVCIGLVSKLTSSNDSVAIGRSAECDGASNSVAIGRGAKALTGNSAAIGYNVEATRQNFVTVNELELKVAGGGIIIPSPNGTLYKLTVDDTGILSTTAV